MKRLWIYSLKPKNEEIQLVLTNKWILLIISSLLFATAMFLFYIKMLIKFVEFQHVELMIDFLTKEATDESIVKLLKSPPDEVTYELYKKT